MATISLYHFFRTRFFWAALFMALVSPSPTAHAGTILYVDAFGECGGKPNCFLNLMPRSRLIQEQREQNCKNLVQN